MTKRWIKGEFGKNDAQQVDAVLLPGIPGVFLNREPNNPNLWVISHRGSGLRLGSYLFPRLADAKKVCRMLTKELDMDWTIKNPHKLVRSHPGLEKTLRKIIKDTGVNYKVVANPKRGR